MGPTRREVSSTFSLRIFKSFGVIENQLTVSTKTVIQLRRSLRNGRVSRKVDRRVGRG